MSEQNHLQPASPGPTCSWVDSHCHLPVDPDEAAKVIERAREAGVAWMVCVGTDLASSKRAVEFAKSYPKMVRASVGLHPHDAADLNTSWPEIAALALEPEVVAIGEAGLDLHYNHSPKDAQVAAFVAQIGLAQETGKALVVHTRQAWPETFAIFESEGLPDRTVLHCFTGGPGEAERAVAIGAHLSFSGIISFKNADDVRAAATLVPKDRLLVETDSPFLAPVPHRGRPNEPGYVAIVGEALAKAKGISVEITAEVTTTNAARIFAHL